MQGCDKPMLNIKDPTLNIQPGSEWDAPKAALLELNDCLIDKHALCSRPNLSKLKSKIFTKQKEVRLLQEPEGIRFIDKHVWVCQNNGQIEIYDLDLERTDMFCNAQWKDVCDVAELPDKTLVLACRGGLFHITSKGKQKSIISNDKYNSVVYASNCLYVYAFSTSYRIMYL